MKMQNKRKWLTAYALACGYVETTIDRNGFKVKLFDNKAVCYEVVVFDEINRTTLFRDSYLTLTKARMIFSQKRKEYNLRRKVQGDV